MITTKDIIIDPHATLRARAEEVKSPISDEDKAILRGLLEYVIASQDDEKAEKLGLKPGIGLAAPQINVSKRMIAVHIPDEEFPEDTVSYALYNPKIISNSVFDNGVNPRSRLSFLLANLSRAFSCLEIYFSYSSLAFI